MCLALTGRPASRLFWVFAPTSAARMCHDPFCRRFEGMSLFEAPGRATHGLRIQKMPRARPPGGAARPASRSTGRRRTAGAALPHSGRADIAGAPARLLLTSCSSSAAPPAWHPTPCHTGTARARLLVPCSHLGRRTAPACPDCRPHQSKPDAVRPRAGCVAATLPRAAAACSPFVGTALVLAASHYALGSQIRPHVLRGRPAQSVGPRGPVGTPVCGMLSKAGRRSPPQRLVRGPHARPPLVLSGPRRPRPAGGAPPHRARNPGPARMQRPRLGRSPLGPPQPFVPVFAPRAPLPRSWLLPFRARR